MLVLITNLYKRWQGYIFHHQSLSSFGGQTKIFADARKPLSNELNSIIYFVDQSYCTNQEKWSPHPDVEPLAVHVPPPLKTLKKKQKKTKNPLTIF